MEWIVWTIGAVACIFFGIPLIKYILSRLWVYIRLWGLRITKRAFVVFRHPFSLWAFHRSKYADIMVVCGRKGYLIKFGGSFKRGTRIEADTPTAWRFRRYWRSVGPLSAPMITEVFVRTKTMPFDLAKDTVMLKSKIHADVLLDDISAVYMLTPKPLSIVANDGKRRELSNGDSFFGMTLYTAKRFFKVCRGHSPESLSKEEKRIIKESFRKL